MMNDPTRSSDSKHPPPSINQGLEGFSSLPVRPSSQETITDDGWSGTDLDQQAQARNDAQRNRNDALQNRADQQDREEWQAWDNSAANDKADRRNQGAFAQQGLLGTQQQGQAASDAMMKALDQQQQQQTAHSDRMAVLEQKAAELAKPKPAAPPAGGGASGNSGGLTNVTVSQNNITIKIWDHGTVDNDTIILKINGVAVTKAVDLKGPSEPFIYNATLSQQSNKIEVYAVDEGTLPPNTASVWTSHVTQGKADQVYSINQDEKASYGITVSY